MHEVFDHTKSGRRSLGHRASSRVFVRVNDPEVVGRLMERATKKLAAEIDGPEWQVAADNPAWLEAARQAAADGRRKAQAYAEGVGARLGRLIQLTEPGTEFVRPIRVAAARVAMPESPGSMPIEAGEHEVAASVHVTFALDVS